MPFDYTLTYDPEFAARVPGARTFLFTADVTNGPTTEALRAELDSVARDIAARYAVGDINSRPSIAATRAAYKACGKDPNRYRPSQEQLMRRIVRGLGLYNVNALVDAGNILSLLTGCSVGCFDADKVTGKQLTLGIGREGEPYEGIGRGELNIAGLPVIRDAVGGIGTPTSDNERTKLSEATTCLLASVHLFPVPAGADMAESTSPETVEALFADLFTRFGLARNIKSRLFGPADDSI